MSENRRLRYEPGLDGLRALAVGSVIAYHLGSRWAPGGFLGVDAFFVLSGFLITSLLLSEWVGTGTISFAKFWLRRARRLLPALLLVLVAVAVYAVASLPANQLGQLRGDALATLFYGANWRFIAVGQSYFTLFTDASPLRHMWSLAIEEQFYLVWPLVTFAALYLARGRRWLLAALCSVGIVASVVAMAVVYDRANPSRAYYGTDSRAHLLLIGCLLAVLLTKWTPRTPTERRAVAVAGAIGMAYFFWACASVSDTASWMYYGGYVLFGVAVAAVITSAIQPAMLPLRAALSMRPVVWVGRISYGLYLWHWPVIVVMTESRTGLTGWELAVVRVALTVVFATLSFYLVELPIRTGWRGRRAVVLPAGFVAVGFVVVLATAGAVPLPAYLQGPGRVVKAAGESATPAPSTVKTAAAAPHRLLLMGDSLAVSLLPGLEKTTAANGLQLSSRAYSGCGLLTGLPLDPKEQPYPWSQACSNSIPGHETDAVQETQPDLVIWLSGAWDERDRIVGSDTIRIGTVGGDRVLTQLVDEAVHRLSDGGARLVFVFPAPDAPGTQLSGDAQRNTRLAHLNAVLRRYATAHQIGVVDLAPIVCPQGQPCAQTVGGKRLRPDGYHFSASAARWVADRLLPRLLAAG